MKNLLTNIFFIATLFLGVLSAPAHAWKMEAGKLTLTATSSLSQLQTHSFQQIYDVPPIVIALPTSAGSQPGALRISDISTTGFRMSPVEPKSVDGPHAAMTVSYIAIEPGVHTFPDGETIEAGTIATDKMQFNGNPNGRKQWETLNYATTFSSPVLLADIQTTSNETAIIPRQPSQPWLTVAISNIANTQANIALERSEVFDRITGSNYQFDALSSTETIGYVLMNRGLLGNFRASGNVLVNFESLYSSNSVDGWSNGCDNINYSGTYSATPIVVATKSSRNEVDGGWLRECSSNASRISLTVDEDTDQDNERNHTQEDASILLFSTSFFYDSNAATSIPTANTLMLESNTINLPPTSFTSVEFKQIYEYPPAVFLLEDNQNPEPSSVRIRNVSKQGFEVVPVEPDSTVADALDQTTTVQYLAISKGQFQFPDGKDIEIGPVVPPDEIINFQSKRLSGDSWFSFNFATAFSSTPALLSQIQTMNSEPTHSPGSPSQPWMTTAVRNVSSLGGEIALDRAETNTGTISVAEKISFLATAPGIIADFKAVNGSTISSEAQATSDTIAGTVSCYAYNFLQAYPVSPLVVGSQMRWDGGDGGWLRRCSTTNTQVRLKIEEDWALDRDNAHTTESAGFLAFSEPFHADFSLIANYQLEGPTWNVTGAVIDSSNSGLHGTAIGNARPFPAKVCNGALFDGTGDYVEIPDNPILDISDELTVMAWVKATAFPTSDLKTIVSKDNNFEFHIDSVGRVLWWWQNSSGGTRSFDSNALRLTVGNWHHVAITYSKSAASQKIFIDGVQANNRTYANESLINNNLPLFIGTDYNYRSRDLNGSIDEVKIFKRALSSQAIQKYALETRPCASCVLGSFEITQPTYTLACPDTRADIDITARCVDGSIKTDYAGTIDLSAPSGGSFFDSDVGGNSITSLSYAFSDNGTKTVYLYFDNEQNGVQVTATDTSASVSNTAVDGTNFRAFGFRVAQEPVNFVCGNNTSLTLEAYGKTNNGSGQTCEVITGFSGDKELDVWFRASTDDDGTPDIVSSDLTVHTTAINKQDDSADENLTLNFVNGSSSFNLAYPNTAKFIDLNFRLDSAPYDGSPFDEMASSTSDFVVYPAQFHLTAQNAGADINGTSSNSLTRHVAGDTFDLGITAQCSDGSTPTDFKPTQSATGIMAYLQRTGPTGGGAVDGKMPISASKILTSSDQVSIAWETTALSSSDFVNGQYNFSGASFSEVGLTRLHIEGRDYFGQDIPQSFLDIGRFIPSYFTVSINDGAYAPFCDIGSEPDFTYIGQPFSYLESPSIEVPSLIIQAYNSLDEITQNYTEGSFLKLSTANNNINRGFPTIDGTALGLDGLTNMMVTTTPNIPFSFSAALNGTIKYSFSNTDSFEYSRDSNSLVAPFYSDLEIDINFIRDADGVESNAHPYIVSPSAIQLRYGRWAMDGAFGPETQSLAIPMRIEFWNGSAFKENISDNCSTYDASDMIVTPTLSGGTTSLSGNGTLIFGEAPLNSQLSLSAPLANNTGTVDLEFQVDSWLRYDWDNNPVTSDTNPTAVVSFGQFRGHDRIIYWREMNN